MDPAEVTTREALAAFLDQLGFDVEANPDAWQNITLQQYFAAVAAWVRDARQGQIPELPPEAWRATAQFFYVGRIYE